MPLASLRNWTCPAIFCLLAGCASTKVQSVSYRPPAPPSGIVLVVDGAGGAPEAAMVAAKAIKQAGSPMYVRSFVWTHGGGLGVSDMTDVDHARAQGKRLAQEVVRYRTGNPQTPITLLAYSAGSHVALESARWLEPNSLERIILLAPAVSGEYDLRPALASARRGVDSFNSVRDVFFLGFGAGVVGTADGKLGVAPAGRLGFEMPPLSGPDLVLAQRLHQHAWDPSIEWTGNTGNHAGTLQPVYFKTYVLPLLISQGP